MGISLGNKDNQIQTLNKKIMTLTDRNTMLVSDIKAKDEFLQQYLVGRSKDVSETEKVAAVLEKYQQKFCFKENE